MTIISGAANTTKNPFRLIKKLRDLQREAGGSLKLRCEAAGEPPVKRWTWFKNDAPLIPERNRVKVIPIVNKGSLDFECCWNKNGYSPFVATPFKGRFVVFLQYLFIDYFRLCFVM